MNKSTKLALLFSLVLMPSISNAFSFTNDTGVTRKYKVQPKSWSNPDTVFRSEGNLSPGQTIVCDPGKYWCANPSMQVFMEIKGIGDTGCWASNRKFKDIPPDGSITFSNGASSDILNIKITRKDGATKYDGVAKQFYKGPENRYGWKKTESCIETYLK